MLREAPSEAHPPGWPGDGPVRTVSLPAIDPVLADAVPVAERARASHIVRAMEHQLPAGRFDAALLATEGRRPLGLLVRQGVIGRRVRLAGGRASAQLLTPGDVCHPWSLGSTLHAESVEWFALTPASLVVVDDRLQVFGRRWPELPVAFFSRLHEQLHEAAATAAMLSLPRIDQRLLALLWQLADKIGRATPDGVILDLPLTHAMLGDLVGAKRPTVSLALTALADEGVLRRDGDRWHLAHDSNAGL